MLIWRCLIILTLVGAQCTWAYLIGHPAFSLQRYLEANPSQQPLMEQLSARVYSEPIPLSTRPPDTQKIAVVLRGEESDLKNRAWLMVFKRRMQELAVDYRLDLFFISPQDRFEQSSHAFKSITHSNFDYLILDNLDEFSRPNVEKILKTRTPKVIMLNMLAPLKAWQFYPPLIYIGVDVSKTMSRLASYIERLVDKEDTVSVFVTRELNVDEQRCRIFINEWLARGRSLERHYVLDNTREAAFAAAQDLAKRMSFNEGRNDRVFIFSCTQALSEGVLKAAQEHPQIMTNTWNDQLHRHADRKNILVTVLDMYDNMAIATAETIKADVESRLLPNLYMESSRLLSQDMDQETRNIMFQQAFRYSSPLWLQ